MEALAQRLCWNTAGWRKPSGEKKEKGFPAEEGFGLEEWNFCVQDAIDGNVLGYTYSMPDRKEIREDGKPCQIVFFTIDPQSDKRLVCGIYHAARRMTDADYARAEKLFKSRGIFDRRAAELTEAAPDLRRQIALRHMHESLQNRSIKWKCPISKLQVFSEMPQLHSIVKRQVGERFKLFTYINLIGPINVKAGENRDDRERNELLEDVYSRNISASTKTITPKHNRLSNQLCAWLKKSGVNPVQERDRIDVRFERQSRTYICELKVCFGNTRQAIRAALGQLLEYNFYPPRAAADQGLIVLDQEPSEADLKFVKKIRTEIKMEVYLGWRSGKKFRFNGFAL